jgi:peptidyl-tRNA hydrolase, PTH1 family
MKLIVGLGNPGREYERTRHNVGWWVLDHLADVWRFEGWKRDGKALSATTRIDGTMVRLLKPQTFMNLSGEALSPYLRRPFWSAAKDMLVIVDEVALPLGTFRIRANGSAGGHNGLKSVERAVGGREYARLRVGIQPEDERMRGDLADYVLHQASSREREVIGELMPTIAEAVGVWVREGAGVAMNRFNGKVGASGDE